MESIEAYGLSHRSLVLLQLAALDQGRVQVQVMGHDCCANDADGDVNHSCLVESRSNESASNLEQGWLGLRQNENLNEIAQTDGCDQQQDDCFECSHTESLQGEQQQHVEASDDDCPKQRDMKHEV